MLLLPLSPFSAEAFGLGIGARVIGKHLPDILDFGVCGVLKLFNSSCPQFINDFRGSQNLPEDISAGTLLLNFSIGDARQKVSLIADTTTDLTFMLCQPCRDCAVEANIAVYNISRPETFSKYMCQGSTECLGSRYKVCSSESCTYYYADYPYVSSKGFLAKDTFFVSDDNPVPVVFGCGMENTGNFGNSAGYVGLGLGNLSFVSQLNVSIFSYCFSSFPSESAVFFGSDVRLHDSALSSSTKLLPNRIDPALYYVNMTGITVGNKRVEIPTTVYLPQPNGRGGIIVDSVSSVTLLEESVYLSCLAIQMRKQMKNEEKNKTKEIWAENIRTCIFIFYSLSIS
ncbi:Eukaryotic aspartyl protease family protein [Rhynchospora pubera]|uniref:Eukaryotic aspartyl protease family protein n=1 Tax=Rhynchospora pubera TaxID=906938 RepID=A0AAV8FEE7_9POAL|nr:Eukaryotic aspartyl protease family protein [Rhynchospora pubera]